MPAPVAGEEGLSRDDSRTWGTGYAVPAQEVVKIATG